MNMLKRFLSLALVLTLVLGTAVQAEGFAGLEEIDSSELPPAVEQDSEQEQTGDEYVQFVCKPSGLKLTVVSLTAEGADSLSVKEKKTMLAGWDGESAEVSRGAAVYRVRKYAAISGKQHAYALAEGMYFVRAEAKGYNPLNWTAVSVRYEDGVMEMKLSLTAASAATAKPIATEPPVELENQTKGDDTLELQRVVFWCDPAKLNLTVREVTSGEKVAPVSISGSDSNNGMDLVATAEYTYYLAAGEYVYTAKCDGYIPLENVAFTVGEEDRMIDLSLKSEIRFADVRIILKEGQRITSLYEASDADKRNIAAGADGVYGLAPGYYQCVVTDAEGQETVHNLTVNGDQREQTILLEPMSLEECSLQAVRFELWQEGTSLTVYTLVNDGERFVCEPDENGLYQLPAGPVWYDASAEGYEGVEAQCVLVEPTEGEQVVRVWLLSDSRKNVNRTKNVVIFATIANKSGAQPFGEELTALLEEVGLVRADYFYSNKRSDGKYESVYFGVLEEDNVWFAVDLLNSSSEIAFAEPEYLYFTTESEILESWNSNPGYQHEQDWLKTQEIRAIWKDLERQDITPGQGVVVAVIDTGVDYTHPDLRANIWVNWQESGGIDGVDDDGNGYVDDVYGWNFVSENNNVKDDHGHGTHVAGIIAMADNDIGGVGIAYGAKIMSIKAGQASGTFSSSAIARAVLYAKANGADIINMSFGGYSTSTIVENALKSAYTDCLLVAAAGNDGKPTIDTPIIAMKDNMYPAGYPYVLGVMATDDSGVFLTNFSNWDGKRGRGCEYELAAPGAAIYSTLPGGRYARWSGTSMAAPVASGAAAVLMSTGMSGSRYLTGQLVGASEHLAFQAEYEFFVTSLDLASALNSTPIPELTLIDVAPFDDASFDDGAVNNGDGVCQNSETIELGLTLRNRWGAAKDVQITASSLVNGIDPGFITWVDNTAAISAVGTFADANTGYIYNDGELTGVSDPLRFVINKDVAHNVEIPITFTVTAKNGLDEEDATAYSWDFETVVTVENGAVISGILTEDTTLTADRMWIIRGSAQVPEGITLTVEAGTHIHFEPNEEVPRPYLQILGTANFSGTSGQPITITSDTNFGIVSESVSGSGLYNFFFRTASSTIDCTMSYVNIYSKYINTYVMASSMKNVRLSGVHVYSRQYTDCYLSDCAVSVAYRDEVEFVGSYLYDVYFEQHTTQKHLSRTFSGCVVVAPSGYMLYKQEDRINASAILNRLSSPEYRPVANTSDGPMDLDMSGNYWGTDNQKVIADLIRDSNDSVAYGTITYEPFLTKSSDMSSIYPFVVDAWVTDAEGNRLDTVLGAQEITFHVLFNRDMNTNTDLTVAYGPAEPYNDYRVNGEWVSARKWEGTYQVNPSVDYGTMYIYVAGGHAASDYWLETAPDSRHWFDFAGAGAEALILQSWAEGDGIHLTWTQDDFDTLAGYNIYRSQQLDENGALKNAVKINDVLIPSDTLSFVDTNVVEGETYYYQFTVVQTDFAESDGSNVTTCTALDMTKPVIKHTPVASVIAGQALSVSATVTDNVKVASVTLYARVQGDSTWTITNMTNTTGNLWYANMVVNGSTPIEYYLSATDGVCTETFGTDAAPMVVIVESGSATLGDLNADGSVDILDLMMMTQAISGEKNLTIMQTKAADINVDGVVDVFDLMRVAQYICGMIESL